MWLLLALGWLLAATEVAPSKGDANESEAGSPISTIHHQLLLVRTQSWTASSGTLQRYARPQKGPWQPVGPPIRVTLGRHGMAWGLGLHPRQAKAPRKREGDGRSPAGVFALGQAFGVADELPAGGQNSYPYLQTSPTTYCVEDTRSTYYNQIVDLNDVGRTRWERWSPMKRPDGLFDWGIVVRQNRPNPVKSAGSCVFLHIWRGPHQPTAGCTAMARDDIEKILRWLDGGENPVLVQLPDPIVDDLRLSWALP